MNVGPNAPFINANPMKRAAPVAGSAKQTPGKFQKNELALDKKVTEATTALQETTRAPVPLNSVANAARPNLSETAVQNPDVNAIMIFNGMVGGIRRDIKAFVEQHHPKVKAIDGYMVTEAKRLKDLRNLILTSRDYLEACQKCSILLVHQGLTGSLLEQKKEQFQPTLLLNMTYLDHIINQGMFEKVKADLKIVQVLEINETLKHLLANWMEQYNEKHKARTIYQRIQTNWNAICAIDAQLVKESAAALEIVKLDPSRHLEMIEQINKTKQGLVILTQLTSDILLFERTFLKSAPAAPLASKQTKPVNDKSEKPKLKLSEAPKADSIPNTSGLLIRRVHQDFLIQAASAADVGIKLKFPIISDPNSPAAKWEIYTRLALNNLRSSIRKCLDEHRDSYQAAKRDIETTNAIINQKRLEITNSSVYRRYIEERKDRYDLRVLQDEMNYTEAQERISFCAPQMLMEQLQLNDTKQWKEVCQNRAFTPIKDRLLTLKQEGEHDLFDVLKNWILLLQHHAPRTYAAHSVVAFFDKITDFDKSLFSTFLAKMEQAGKDEEAGMKFLYEKMESYPEGIRTLQSTMIDNIAAYKTVSEKMKRVQEEAKS